MDKKTWFEIYEEEFEDFEKIDAKIEEYWHPAQEKVGKKDNLQNVSSNNAVSNAPKPWTDQFEFGNLRDDCNDANVLIYLVKLENEDWFEDEAVDSLIASDKATKVGVIEAIKDEFSEDIQTYLRKMYPQANRRFVEESFLWRNVTSLVKKTTRSTHVNNDMCIIIDLLSLLVSDILNIFQPPSQFKSLVLGDVNGGYSGGLGAFFETNFDGVRFTCDNIRMNPYREDNEDVTTTEDAFLVHQMAGSWYPLHKPEDLLKSDVRHDVVEAFGSAVFDLVCVTMNYEECLPIKIFAAPNQTVIEIASCFLALKVLKKHGCLLVWVKDVTACAWLGILSLFGKVFSKVVVAKSKLMNPCALDAFIGFLDFVGQSDPICAQLIKKEESIIDALRRNILNTLIPLPRYPIMLRERVLDLVELVFERVTRFMELNLKLLPYGKEYLNEIEPYQEALAESWLHKISAFSLRPNVALKPWFIGENVFNCNDDEMHQAFGCYYIVDLYNVTVTSRINRLNRKYLVTPNAGFCKAIWGPVAYAAINLKVSCGYSKLIEPMARWLRTSRFVQTTLLCDQKVIRQIQRDIVDLGDSIGMKNCARNPCLYHGKDTLMCALSEIDEVANMEPNKLKIQCFFVKSNEFFLLSDLELFSRKIRLSLEAVTSLMIGESVFLCRYALYSRLLYGSVCLLSRCFERAFIVLSPDTSVAGILFFNYKGASMSLTIIIERLHDVLRRIEEKQDNVKLEIFETQILLNAFPIELVSVYNEFILRSDLRRYTTSVIAFRKSNVHIN